MRILRAFGILLALGAFSFAWAQDGGDGELTQEDLDRLFDDDLPEGMACDDYLILFGMCYEQADPRIFDIRPAIESIEAARLYGQYCIEKEAPDPAVFSMVLASLSPILALNSKRLDLTYYSLGGQPALCSAWFYSNDEFDEAKQAFEIFSSIDGFQLFESESATSLHLYRVVILRE